MNTIDEVRMKKQENKDFTNAVRVFNKILGSKKYTAKFNQMPLGSASDMRFNADNRYFNVEIKERNQDMDKYPQLPLKLTKFKRLIEDTKEYEKLLYIVLVNNEEYYIYDLENIDFSETTHVEYDPENIDFSNLVFTDWTIKKVQYSVEEDDKVEYETVPTFFIPISYACASGKIPR